MDGGRYAHETNVHFVYSHCSLYAFLIQLNCFPFCLDDGILNMTVSAPGEFLFNGIARAYVFRLLIHR